jgi:cytochrome c
MQSGNPRPAARPWMRTLAWATAIGLAIRAFSEPRRPGGKAHRETSRHVLRGSPVTWSVLAVLAAMAAVFAGGQVSMHREEAIARAMTGGNPSRAPLLIRRYGCGGCHTISGVPGADGKVAAPLDQFRQRVFIAGVLRNTPDNLRQWIVAPQNFSSQSAMPASGITENEARDVAAFLYAH